MPVASGLQDNLAKRQASLEGKVLAPAAPQEIVINGKQTGQYLTGGNMVGQNMPPPGTPTPQQEQAAQNPLPDLPNYEKLTGVEKWVMNAMAGIPKPIAEALDTFNSSWAGQALAWLDIPAEGLERAAGLGTQALAAYGNKEHWDEFNKNLTAAWYAGSTTAEFGNIPQVVIENGAIKFNYTDDMPGLDGTIRVRKAIAANVAAGMEYSAALEKAKNEELTNLGALAIRAQTQDMFMHIAGDPLNVIMPFLSPVERLNKARAVIQANKIQNTLGVATDIIKAEGVVAQAVQALADAQKGGDVVSTALAAQKLTEAKAVLSGVEDTMKLAEVSKLTRAESFVLWVTGGADDMPVSEMTNAQKFWRKVNPIALTPEARAQEHVSTILENINSRIIPAISKDGQYDVAQLNRIIQRSALGASSPDLGHLIATTDGQHVKSVLSAVAQETGSIARSVEATKDFERPLIDLMNIVLGDSPKKIMTQLADGKEVELFTRFQRKLSDGSEAAAAWSQSFAELLARQGPEGLLPEQFTAEFMKLSLNVFKGNDLYDDGAAVAQILNKIADITAQQSIARFGITERGFITKLANMTKQAETLAFMRLNPTYPVRNFINNVVTMYARGALGFMTPGQIEDIFKLRGFTPLRLVEGVGAAGDAEKLVKGGGEFSQGLQTAQNVLGKAVRGEGGWIDNLTDGIRDLPKKIGIKQDFGSISSKIESWASQNAMATFYLRGEQSFNDFKTFGKSGLLTKLGDFDPALAQRLGDKIVGEIQDVVRDSKLSPQLLEQNIASNAPLNITFSKLRSAVETKLGQPLGSIVTDEFMESVAPQIMKAVESGNTDDIPRAFKDVRQKLNAHIQGLNDNALPAVGIEVANRVQAEGPKAFARIWGDTIDEWYGGIMRHDIDVAKAADGIRTLKDKAMVNSQWNRAMLEGENFFNRQWERLGSRLEGLATGAEKVGLEVSASKVKQSFDVWRDTWKSFFDERKALYNSYFERELSGAGNAMTFDQITAQLDKSYSKAVATESRMTADIDKMVASALPNEIKPTYLAWRKRVADLREADKMAVQDFRAYIRTIHPDEIPTAYEAFGKTRRENITALWKEERMGEAALKGNPKAVQELAPEAKEISKIQGVAQQLLDVKKAGQRLTPKEQAIVDKYIAQVADSETVAYLDGLKEAINEAKDNYKAVSESAASAREFTNTRLSDLKKFFNPDGTAKKFAGIDPQQDPGAWLENMQNYLGKETPLFNQTDDIAAAEGHAKSAFTQWDAIKGAKGNTDKLIAELQQEIVSTEDAIIAGAKPKASALGGVADEVVEQAPTTKAFVSDYDEIIKPEMYTGTGLDELTYTKGQDAIKLMEAEAQKMATEPPTRWSDLAPEQQEGIRHYLETIKGDMSDARYAATKFGEYGRDSALLNYNRKTNFNSWVGTVMPYEFWASSSMVKWALHSIDRPAMLTTYLRMKKFLETAYRPENGLPSRLRGTLRIPMPWLPDWMGDEGFIDPLKTLLPFDSWSQPFEAFERERLGDEGATIFKLKEQLSDGVITQFEYDQATNEKVGAVWENALTEVQRDDSEERLNAWDFTTMLTSPHAPLQWAYNAATGKETGAVLPITNTLGNVLGAFGLDPAGPLNPEAAIRKSLGYHPFNKWDDYYVERMVVNMVAQGDLSASEAKQAMIDHKGAAWEEAYRKTWMEKSMGGMGQVLSFAGFPVKGYPAGEEELRKNWPKMKEEYNAAWDVYNKTGDYARTVGRFNEKYPEYESRLALFDKPEVRLSKFLEQSLWDKWNNLNRVERESALEQMPDFQGDFINKETRVQNVPPEKLALWLKFLGGEGEVGSLNVSGAAPLKMPPPEVSQLAQSFYDSRNRMFPGWYEKQEAYYALQEKSAERKQFLQENPMLKTYWGWRTDFLKRNSQIVPYVTDTAPKWYKPEMADQKGLDLTWDEWRTNLGWTVSNLVLDYANGEDLPPVAQAQLQKAAAEYGWQGSVEDFAQMIADSER